MKFNIVDYNIKKHKDLDDWTNESKHVNAKLINKYATYNEPISESYQYFLDNPFDMANIKSFIKVFEHNNTPYGIAMFHYYKEEDEYYLAINPIIINPEFINQGLGTKIMKLITLKAKEIAEGQVDIVKGDVEEGNIASIRILEKADFIRGEKKDNFIEYFYKMTK